MLTFKLASINVLYGLIIIIFLVFALIFLLIENRKLMHQLKEEKELKVKTENLLKHLLHNREGFIKAYDTRGIKKDYKIYDSIDNTQEWKM